MFFGPKCPVSTFEKVSLEWDFQRVLDSFGIENLQQRKTLIPADPLLALHSVRSEKDVLELKRRIAEHFGVDDGLLEVHFFEGEDGDVPTIQEEGGQIVAHISTSMLSERVRVASHLASSFATCICQSDEFVSSELNAEIVAMWYGFGPIMAEASIMTSKYTIDGFDHWSISKHGWLSAIQLGYVMAVREFLLSNALPDWHKQLVIDAKDSLAKGLKYLNKTSDCLVDDKQSCLHWEHARCESAFNSKFASQRLAALEFFPRNNDVLSDGELTLVLAATNDKDDFVRSSGMHLLEFAQNSTDEVVRAVEIGLDDHNPQIQLGAIRASSIHGASIDGLGYTLQMAIEGTNPEIMNYAAASMAANDLCGEKELKLILEKLRRSIVRGAEVDALLGVLQHVNEDPKQLVLDYFEDDEDLRGFVEGWYEDSEKQKESE